MVRELTPRWRTGGAVLLGALSLLVFVSTLQPHPIPGDPTSYVLQYGGLDPAPPVSYPLYARTAYAFAQLPLSTLPWRLGLLSALTGAVCIGLMTWLLMQPHQPALGEWPPYTGLVRGAAAALYLTAAPPFWSAANRAGPVLFHLALLLLGLCGLQRYRHAGSRLGLLGGLAILGLGMLEWSILFGLAPLLLGLAMFDALRRGEFGALRVAAGAVAFCAGLAVFFWLFHRTCLTVPSASGPGSWLDSLRTVGQLVHAHLDELWFAFANRYGVLFVLLCLIPWVLAWWHAETVSVTDEMGQTAALYVVLLCLNGIVLYFHLVAPGPAAAFFDRLPAIAMVTSAAGFGVAIGFLHGWADDAWRTRRALRWAIQAGLAILTTAFVLTGAILQTGVWSTRYAEDFHAWAGGVLDEIPEGGWLVARGPVADHLAIEAAARDRSVQQVNLSRSVEPGYQAYWASAAPDPLGGALARRRLDWMWEAVARSGEREGGDLNAVDPADLTAVGRPATPRRTVYTGAAPEDSFATNEPPPADGRGVAARLRPHAARSDFIGAYSRHLLRLAARIANDRAVLHLRRGRAPAAAALLETARALDEHNPVVLMNLLAAAADMGRFDFVEAYWRDLSDELPAAPIRLDPADLQRQYGRAVHLGGLLILREAFAGRLLVPQGKEWAAACAELLAGDASAAQRRVWGLVADDPHQPTTWVLAAVCAYAAGDPDQMYIALEQLDILQVDAALTRRAIAQTAVADGRTTFAIPLLERLRAVDPTDGEAAGLLLEAQHLDASVEPDPRLAEMLLASDADHPWAHYTLAAVAARSGRGENAVSHLRAAAAGGGIPYALLWLAEIETPTRPEDQVDAATGTRLLSLDVEQPRFWQEVHRLLLAGRGPDDLVALAGLRAADDVAGAAPAPDLGGRTYAARKSSRTRPAPPPEESARVAPEVDSKPSIAPPRVEPSPGRPEPEKADASPAPSARGAELDDENAPVPLLW